ncbi:MAG: hypothetical protein MI674_04155 [Cytophagales bacterium]|nr:hypothetical protein [Cytophagales bacterium]
MLVIDYIFPTVIFPLEHITTLKQFNFVLGLFLALCTIGCKNQPDTTPDKELLDTMQAIVPYTSYTPDLTNEQQSIVNKALESLESPKTFEQKYEATVLAKSFFENPSNAINRIGEKMIEARGEVKKEEYRDFLTFVFKILSQLPSPSDTLYNIDGLERMDGSLSSIIIKHSKEISKISSEELFPMTAYLEAITSSDKIKAREFLPRWFAEKLKALDNLRKNYVGTDDMKTIENAFDTIMKSIGLKEHYKSTYKALEKQYLSIDGIKEFEKYLEDDPITL